MAAHRAVAVDRDFDAVRVALVAHEAQGRRVPLGAGAVGVDGLTAPAARWNQEVNAQLLTLENDLILTDVATNPPVSEFNSVAHRIMSIVPVVPAYGNHQVGVSVRQTG
jgi:hypothetical protein